MADRPFQDDGAGVIGDPAHHVQPPRGPGHHGGLPRAQPARTRRPQDARRAPRTPPGGPGRCYSGFVRDGWARRGPYDRLPGGCRVCRDQCRHRPRCRWGQLRRHRRYDRPQRIDRRRRRHSGWLPGRSSRAWTWGNRHPPRARPRPPSSGASPPRRGRGPRWRRHGDGDADSRRPALRGAGGHRSRRRPGGGLPAGRPGRPGAPRGALPDGRLRHRLAPHARPRRGPGADQLDLLQGLPEPARLRARAAPAPLAAAHRHQRVAQLAPQPAPGAGARPGQRSQRRRLRAAPRGGRPRGRRPDHRAPGRGAGRPGPPPGALPPGAHPALLQRSLLPGDRRADGAGRQHRRRPAPARRQLLKRELLSEEAAT